MEQLIFLTLLSLLLLHEMDAIRAKEWKMFIILKDMREETAFKVFTIIHFPLYLMALYALGVGGTAAYALKITVDIFLLAHTLLHYGFRKYESNGFKMVFSKAIIYLTPLLALLHLYLLY